jgi:DDE superfamily endonuclease
VVVGQARAHGGNIQVITAPDGWPIWTSPVRPGREHDTTALRAHAELLPAVAGWTDDGHAVLGDLGYEGEQAALTTPVKRVAGWPLTDDERTINALHAGTRALAERGNALLKTTFKALRRVSPLSLANRRDHRRGPDPASLRARPHHMINK